MDNQPIESTVSNHDIAHRLHNGKGSDCPKYNYFVSATATPLGEELQANCPRCNMSWIVHNCQQYPKLLDAKEMIKKLARGAVLQGLAKNADYFTSIKQDGEEFNVYIRKNNKILSPQEAYNLALDNLLVFLNKKEKEV